MKYAPVPGKNFTRKQRAELEALGYAGELEDSDDQ